MFITDVIVDSRSLGLMKKKYNTNIVFLYLFVLSMLLSVGIIVYGIIQKITGYNTYLFGGCALLISGFWLFYVVKNLKETKKAYTQIKDRGEYVYRKVIEVNAQHKHNTSTIVSLVSAIVVSICMIVVAVVQIANYNPDSFYILPMLFVLGVFSYYQTIVNFIDDKIYRNCIFNN